MSALRLIPALSLAALAGACAPTLGPPPPGRLPPPSASADFSPADFAWSQRPGRNGIDGRLAYRQGTTRFTCSGASVVLTPETPWSRRRMAVLYGSTDRAALPADEVRARTDEAPSGDAGPYVKRTTCDSADRFRFSGLADGAWYVITIARPADREGESMAMMRRVVLRGGRTAQVAM